MDDTLPEQKKMHRALVDYDTLETSQRKRRNVIEGHYAEEVIY